MKNKKEAGKMRTKSKTLGMLAALVVGLIVSGSVVSATQDQLSVQVLDRTIEITVTGTATIEIMPNQVIIEVGIVIEDETATGAWERNAEIASAVIEALKEIGISESQIETIRYSLAVRRDYHGNIIAYVCTHKLQVTVNDLEKAGPVIDAAVGAGANRVYRIDFTRPAEEVKELKRDAFRAAVVDAREQAELIAEAFGAVVVQVVSINPQSTYYYPYRAYFDASGGATPPTTPIQPGEIEITGRITVTYEIGWLRSL
jgi:hypothetical protein